MNSQEPALYEPDWLLHVAPLFDAINEGVIVFEADRAIFVNSTLLWMTGYRYEDVIGHPPSDFFAPADLPFLLEQLDVRQRTGHMRFEFYVLGSQGEQIPVIISSRRYRDAGQREVVIVSCTDIREQKKSEARLHQANAILEKRQKEIEEDLNLAAVVQQSLVPQGRRWQRLAIETYYAPYHGVGGDFGLVHPYNTTLSLVICDVVGHGTAAALLANRVYAQILQELERAKDLAEVLEQLNNFLLRQIGVSGFFLTLVIAQFDHKGRRLRFAAAGHPPAFLVHSDSSIQYLHGDNMTLGISENAAWTRPVQEFRIAPGDRLVLYSDGFTEVFAKQRAMLDIEGFEEVVRRAHSLPLDEMKAAVVRHVQEFRDGPLTDDMTLILVEAVEQEKKIQGASIDVAKS